MWYMYLSHLLVLSPDDFSVVLRLYLLPALTQLQIVDDTEPVIDLVLRVNLFMLFLPHVVLQSGMVTEDTLTVQALKAARKVLM